jgi:hypothetical protein
MEFTTTTIVLLVICAVLFAIAVYALFYIQKLAHKIEMLQSGSPKNVEQNKLKLGAYERLTLFTERTKLENLITRLFNSGFSARDMQQVLTSAIKEEFDYNLSQQLYVKPEIWEAVTKMKEQNIYIVNQVAASLPVQASAMDLNKHLIDLLSANDNVTMNRVVLDALQFETQKML